MIPTDKYFFRGVETTNQLLKWDDPSNRQWDDFSPSKDRIRSGGFHGKSDWISRVISYVYPGVENK